MRLTLNGERRPRNAGVGRGDPENERTPADNYSFYTCGSGQNKKALTSFFRVSEKISEKAHRRDEKDKIFI